MGTTVSPCPRETVIAPEPPLRSANVRQRPHANLKAMPVSDQRATHENTLVIRSSLGDDEDEGAEVKP
jgi:hypothetical protein